MKPTLLTLFASVILLNSQAFAQDGGVQPAAPEQAAEVPKFEGENKEIGSYFMGYQAGYSLARMLSQQGMSGLKVEDLDVEALQQGLKDAIDGTEPSKDPQQSMAAIQSLQTLLQERDQKLAEENRKKGDAYRAERAKEEGVVTTESGLMYKIKTKGEGEVYEAPEGEQQDMQTRFKARYTGRLIDGTEFDSSGEEAITFNLQVVPGFAEALRSMPTGSTWELILKPELAYGDQRAGNLIGPGSTLVFELTLDEIIKPAPPKPRAEAVTPPIQIPPAPKAEDKAGNEDKAGE